MSFFDKIFGIDGAKKNIRQAGQQAQGSLQSAYDDTAAMYQPYRTGGDMAYSSLLDLSGVNGPGAATTAVDNFKSSPFATAGLQQGADAINRSAAGRSGIQNGNTLRALMDYGNDNWWKNYGDYYNRQAGIANQGYDATGRVAAARGNLGTGQAGIQTNVGNQLANADLASGGFLQSLISSGIGAAGYAMGGGFGRGFGVPTSAPTSTGGTFLQRYGSGQPGPNRFVDGLYYG